MVNHRSSSWLCASSKIVIEWIKKHCRGFLESDGVFGEVRNRLRFIPFKFVRNIGSHTTAQNSTLLAIQLRRNPHPQRIQLNKSRRVRLVVRALIFFECRNRRIEERILFR